MIQTMEGMDLADRLREVSNRIQQRSSQVQTEEATKTAMVMPFINYVLGYNVFDPLEVVPEFVADLGTKKHEKVDYAIFRDGEPIMLFECKAYGTDLSGEPASQLYRYFSVVPARFGVLTDGAQYRFYSDIDELNRMDARPFLEINLQEVDGIDVEELKRFTKTSFDLTQILSTAKDLKYTREIMRLLGAEWVDPSEGFVRHFVGQIYEGTKTKQVINQFTGPTKKALHQFVARKINDRLKSALASADPDTQTTADSAVEEEEEEEQVGIVTTEEELRCYYAIIAILSPDVPSERINLKDYLTLCNVLLDNNRFRPICRMYFNSAQKRIGFITVHPDEPNTEEKVPIDSINDIFHYADKIRATVRGYELGDSGETVETG